MTYRSKFCEYCNTFTNEFYPGINKCKPCQRKGVKSKRASHSTYTERKRQFIKRHIKALSREKIWEVYILHFPNSCENTFKKYYLIELNLIRLRSAEMEAVKFNPEFSAKLKSMFKYPKVEQYLKVDTNKGLTVGDCK